ncbi:hypothetical protein [Aureibacillus halotolerans]|uniref:Uncharacterized protein n=1 Tax=Aureibacillus halotolerans TaxID=1508390 RepID=A0A4R6TVB4_9BACI|nr:hypothetical protein [Aureibacillus halotolerans]TDQ37720.1 hypothetical protein EV213_11280 [Aureibacillus halotolerans]
MIGTKNSKQIRVAYLIVGTALIGVSIYINYPDLSRGEFPDALMQLALGINMLMLAYLSPHLFPRDERSKAIIGKSMIINHFVLFASIAFLYLLTGPLGPVTLSSTQVLVVLFCVMALTIPGAMIVYTKLI